MRRPVVDTMSLSTWGGFPDCEVGASRNTRDAVAERSEDTRSERSERLALVDGDGVVHEESQDGRYAPCPSTRAVAWRSIRLGLSHEGHVMLRCASGGEHYRCGQQYCPRCCGIRARCDARALDEAIEGMPFSRLGMLTLTAPHDDLVAGRALAVSAMGDLRSTDLWRETIEFGRWNVEFVPGAGAKRFHVHSHNAVVLVPGANLDEREMDRAWSAQLARRGSFGRAQWDPSSARPGDTPETFRAGAVRGHGPVPRRVGREEGRRLRLERLALRRGRAGRLGTPVEPQVRALARGTQATTEAS